MLPTMGKTQVRKVVWILEKITIEWEVAKVYWGHCNTIPWTGGLKQQTQVSLRSTGQKSKTKALTSSGKRVPDEAVSGADNSLLEGPETACHFLERARGLWWFSVPLTPSGAVYPHEPTSYQRTRCP